MQLVEQVRGRELDPGSLDAPLELLGLGLARCTHRGQLGVDLLVRRGREGDALRLEWRVPSDSRAVTIYRRDAGEPSTA